MRTQKAEYALYRGDEFIIVGTIKEIAKKQHVKESTIRYYASPCYRKKTKGKGYILIKVDEDE